MRQQKDLTTFSLGNYYFPKIINANDEYESLAPSPFEKTLVKRRNRP